MNTYKRNVETVRGWYLKHHYTAVAEKLDELLRLRPLNDLAMALGIILEKENDNEVN